MLKSCCWRAGMRLRVVSSVWNVFEPRGKCDLAAMLKRSSSTWPAQSVCWLSQHLIPQYPTGMSSAACSATSGGWASCCWCGAAAHAGMARSLEDHGSLCLKASLHASLHQLHTAWHHRQPPDHDTTSASILLSNCSSSVPWLINRDPTASYLL